MSLTIKSAQYAPVTASDISKDLHLDRKNVESDVADALLIVKHLYATQIWCCLHSDVLTGIAVNHATRCIRDGKIFDKVGLLKHLETITSNLDSLSSAE